MAIRAGVGWRIVALGAALWAISMAVKSPLAALLRQILGEARAAGVQAALQGCLSAVVELSVAAVYLRTWEGAHLASLLAFGAGAGSAEALYVLGLGLLHRQRDPSQVEAWARVARTSLCVRYTVPLERFFALLGHTGSRGLVYVGLHAAPPMAFAAWMAALTLFSAIDSVAVYGHLRSWDWNDPATCRRTHLLFGSLSLMELGIFLLAFRL